MSARHLRWIRTPGLLLVLFSLVIPPLAAAETPLTPGHLPLSNATAGAIYLHLAGASFDPVAGPAPAIYADSPMFDADNAGIQDGPQYYIVQFDGPITDARKLSLRDQGAQLYDYLPDFAFVVRMDGGEVEQVEDLPGVRWVGPYQPAYRVSPSLLVRERVLQGRGELTVLTFPDAHAAVVTRLEALGGEVVTQSQTARRGTILLRTDLTRIEEIAALPGVRWVEPAPERKLFNNVATDLMDVRDVWNNHGLFGAGQTVAICDTGLDKGSTSPTNLHDDFENGSGGTRVLALFDRVGDGADDVLSGHGTHVAGSVLGNGSLSGATPSGHLYPSTSIAGLAPEANLVFQAVEDRTSGDLSGIPLDLNLLFAQADGAGADLHTNSWGAPVSGQYTADSEAVDEYIWNNPDFAILFAGGNEGVDNNGDGVVDLDSMGSPATAKNCITIGASENSRTGQSATYGAAWPSDFPANPINGDPMSDNPSGMAAFSSRGPTDDGRYKPDLVAPGTFIASVRSSEATGNGWGLINAAYMFMGGTSMATPLAAGATTLVRQFYTDREGVTPSAALIKATLINGAASLAPGQYGTGGTQEIPNLRPNNVEGWGRISLEDSLFPPAPRVLKYTDYITGVVTGAEVTFDYQVLDVAQPLQVTLVWSDYPSSPAGGGGLVNDLDLTVSGPASQAFTPAGALQRAGGEIEAATVDNVNNVEAIRVAAPSLGVYTIKVRGVNVPQGPQPFALVLSGAVTAETLSVGGIQPGKAPNNGVLQDAVITGRGFVGSTSVQLVRNTDVIAGVISVLGPGGETITADFDLTGAQPGLWDLRASNSGGASATLPGAFVVVDSTLPNLRADTAAQQTEVEPGESLTFTISIQNQGFVTATQVIFTDTLPQDADFDRLTPGCEGSTITLPGGGGFACQIAGGTLPAGENVVYTLVVSVHPDADSTLRNHIVVGSQEPDGDVSDNSDEATVNLPAQRVFVPLVAKQWPPLPAVPALNPIDNGDHDGDYVVAWGAAARAIEYTLQEATNAAFSDAAAVYTGSGLSKSISSKGYGTYYYRVRANNTFGNSGWSNSQAVVVAPNLPDTVTSVADTFVLEGYPGSNVGSEPELWAGYDDYLDPNGKIVRGLVKFDLSAIPPAASIGQATLYLYLSSSYDFAGQSRTIVIHRAGSPWTESGVVWSTQPSVGEAYGSATVTHGDWRWYTFDVTSLLQGWVDGTWQNHGLIVRGPEHSGPDSSWKGFFTREQSGYAPYIAISYGLRSTLEDGGGITTTTSGPQQAPTPSSPLRDPSQKVLEKADAH